MTKSFIFPLEIAIKPILPKIVSSAAGGIKSSCKNEKIKSHGISLRTFFAALSKLSPARHAYISATGTIAAAMYKFEKTVPGIKQSKKITYLSTGGSL